MKGKWFAAALLGAVLAAGAPAAAAAPVESVGEPIVLYLNVKETALTEEVRIVAAPDNGVLSLLVNDGAGGNLLTLPNLDGVNCGVAFVIQRIQPEDTDRCFWQVLADRGAHGKFCGYWLIGEQDGAWKVFLSAADMAAEGFTPDQWHLVKSELQDGKYLLISTHEYMPPGARFGYQRKFAEDWRGEAVWDGENWSMGSLPPEGEQEP